MRPSLAGISKIPATAPATATLTAAISSLSAEKVTRSSSVAGNIGGLRSFITSTTSSNKTSSSYKENPVAAAVNSTRIAGNHRLVGTSFESKRQGVRMASTQPLTQSTMPTAEEMKLDTPLSAIQTAPGVQLTDHQKIIVASVLDLFKGKPSLRKLTLWNEDGMFHDPLTVAQGHKQFAAQWYGLAAAFSKIEQVSHKVTSAGNPITMDLVTNYTVKGVNSEKKVDSVIDIFVDQKTGKIEKVLDKWDGDIQQGGVKNAFRKLNAVSVPAMVSVPKSIEEEERKH